MRKAFLLLSLVIWFMLPLLCALIIPSAQGQTIIQQPVNQTAQVGQTTTFTIAISDSTCTVMWQRNGSNIKSGLNLVSYTTPAVSLTDNGTKFGVVVYNCKTAVTAHGVPATLTVIPVIVTLTSLAIIPPAPIIGIGQTEPLTVEGTYSDGSMQDLTSTAIWTSNAPLIASVSSSGVALGIVTGVNTVTATVGSIIASTPVTVEPVLNVTFAPSNEDGTVPTASLQISKVTANPDGTFSSSAVLQLPDPSGATSLSLLYDPAGLYQAALLVNNAFLGQPIPFSPTLMLLWMSKLKQETITLVFYTTTGPPGTIKDLNWHAN